MGIEDQAATTVATLAASEIGRTLIQQGLSLLNSGLTADEELKLMKAAVDLLVDEVQKRECAP